MNPSQLNIIVWNENMIFLKNGVLVLNHIMMQLISYERIYLYMIAKSLSLRHRL